MRARESPVRTTVQLMTEKMDGYFLVLFFRQSQWRCLLAVLFLKLLVVSHVTIHRLVCFLEQYTVCLSVLIMPMSVLLELFMV